MRLSTTPLFRSRRPGACDKLKKPCHWQLGMFPLILTVLNNWGYYTIRGNIPTGSFHASQDDPVQNEALDLCMKQHALGLTHLMVRRCPTAWSKKSSWDSLYLQFSGNYPLIRR